MSDLVASTLARVIVYYDDDWRWRHRGAYWDRDHYRYHHWD
jgi:hypothetical protein